MCEPYADCECRGRCDWDVGRVETLERLVLQLAVLTLGLAARDPDALEGLLRRASRGDGAPREGPYPTVALPPELPF